MQTVGITSLKQALFQEASNTMRNHTITFHLSETETSITATTLHRLSRQDLHRTSCARMDLVVHHMFETLVVRGAEINLRLELSACVAVVHDLKTSGLVAFLAQEGRYGLDREIGEGSCVTLVTDQCC